MFYPLQNMCMKAKTTTDKRDPVAGLRPQHAGRYWRRTPTRWARCGRSRSETGKTLWKYEQRAGVMSLVATGGGLVFGGDVNGRFRAFDDRTGKILWEQNLGAPVSGFPVTLRRGRQAVRRRDHRTVARRQLDAAAHAGAEAQQHGAALRVCAAVRPVRRGRSQTAEVRSMHHCVLVVVALLSGVGVLGPAGRHHSARQGRPQPARHR